VSLLSGDLHLVNYEAPADEGSNRDNLLNIDKLAIVKGEGGGCCCVALAIAQRRTRGKISGVLLEQLTDTLQKLHLVAEKLKGM